MEFKLEPIYKKPFICPACKNEARNMKFTAGNSLSPNIPDIDKSLYDAEMVWGPCTNCKKDIYSIELMFASTAKPGHSLFSSHDYKASKTTAYYLHRQGQSWEYWHCEGVSGVSYYPNGTPDLIFGELEWLDYHFLPEFVFDPSAYSDPIEQGNKLSENMLPVLMEANLQELY